MHISIFTILSVATTALAATHCHGSGQWAKQAEGRSLVTTACNTMTRQAGLSKATCINGSNGIRWNFEAGGTLTGALLFSECFEQMNNIINTCKGNNADTRGGYIDRILGGRTFGVDPNSGAC